MRLVMDDLPALSVNRFDVVNFFQKQCLLISCFVWLLVLLLHFWNHSSSSSDCSAAAAESSTVGNSGPGTGGAAAAADDDEDDEEGPGISSGEDPEADDEVVSGEMTVAPGRSLSSRSRKRTDFFGFGESPRVLKSLLSAFLRIGETGASGCLP